MLNQLVIRLVGEIPDPLRIGAIFFEEPPAQRTTRHHPAGLSDDPTKHQMLDDRFSAGRLLAANVAVSENETGDAIPAAPANDANPPSVVVADQHHRAHPLFLKETNDPPGLTKLMWRSRQLLLQRGRLARP